MNRVEVTQDEFYRTVGPMNVNPHSEREITIWRDGRTLAVVGWSEPGYASKYGTPQRYWIARAPQ